jgi:spermidine synthase
MIVLVLGFVTLLGQVVLLREIGVAFHGSELAYVLGFGFWLCGTALGASHRDDRDPVAALRLAGWAVLPALVLARALRPLLGTVTGAEPGLLRLFVGLALILGPVGFLGGAAFRRVANARLAAGSPLARTYALECLGAAVGGLAATLLPAVGAPGLAGAWVVALAASSLLRPSSWRRVRAAVPIAVALAGLIVSTPFDARLTHWTHPDLLATRDTPYGRLTLDGRDGQVAVFVDDALAYESQGTTAEEFAAIAAVQRETPGAVLVLGGWVEDLAGELVPYHPSRVLDVEVDGALPTLAAPYLDGRVAPADLLLGDPRRLLPLAERFDLLLSALPEPSTGRANRHYTAEFFARCAASLSDDGVLAIRLRMAENLWTPRQAHRAAAVYAALATAFTDVVVLPGADTVFLASNAPLERDAEVLAERFRRANPPTQLASAAWLNWRYANDRTARMEQLLRQANVPANRDLRPTCYADAIMLDLARVVPGVGWRPLPNASRWLWPALAALMVPAILSRSRPALRRAWFAGYAGLAGMGLEIVIVLHDQTGRGVLYRDLGLLLTLFMVGLAAGALAGQTYARRPDGRWRWPVLVAALSGWSCALAFVLERGASGLLFSGAVLLVTGMLVALIFAAAAAAVRQDAGPVYAADVLGGGIGGVVTSLLLVPFAGLPVACLVIAALALPAAVAIWPGRSGSRM